MFLSHILVPTPYPRRRLACSRSAVPGRPDAVAQVACQDTIAGFAGLRFLWRLDMRRHLLHACVRILTMNGTTKICACNQCHQCIHAVAPSFISSPPPSSPPSSSSSSSSSSSRPPPPRLECILEFALVPLAPAPDPPLSSTQFTCFTSTKVQILPAEELAQARSLYKRAAA